MIISFEQSREERGKLVDPSNALKSSFIDEKKKKKKLFPKLGEENLESVSIYDRTETIFLLPFLVVTSFSNERGRKKRASFSR